MDAASSIPIRLGPDGMIGGILLFSYGTLQDEAVQMQLLGRRLQGRSDRIVGYACTTLEITDPSVLKISGLRSHRIASWTGNMRDEVAGRVFLVTREELAIVDRYEIDDYERVSVTLASGGSAQAYVRAAPRPHGGIRLRS